MQFPMSIFLLDKSRSLKVSEDLRFEWRGHRLNAAQRRILLSLSCSGSERYVVYCEGKVVGAMALKKRRHRYRILQMGSFCPGVGRILYSLVCSLPLETVVIPQSVGFFKRMGMVKNEKSCYSNIYINDK